MSETELHDEELQEAMREEEEEAAREFNAMFVA